jgi:hypothetical protein
MTVAAHQPNARRTNGGRIESYEVKCSANLGSISWPTGFSGGGWAVLATDKDTVISRHAFRIDALRSLIAIDGLDATPEELASDLSAD